MAGMARGMVVIATGGFILDRSSLFAHFDLQTQPNKKTMPLHNSKCKEEFAAVLLV
jgi:hypothetical protein